jgi:hypothetical protein
MLETLATFLLITATVAPTEALLAADSTDDGPHVYWQSDSRAIVFYLCNTEFVSRDYDVAGTLQFHGFCEDSEIEYVIPAGRPAIEPYVYEGVSRIFAVSDIHGEYEVMVDLLKNSGIIDDGLHWSWGDGHLVVDGDVFDRGDRVTECLWLIYRLEREAKAAGGRVHMLLGNHEVMVMRDDVRYVNEKYTEGIVRKTRIKYHDLYGPDMELGRWLRSKHVAIKVIPPRLVELEWSLEDISEVARANYDIRSYELAFDDGVKSLYGHTDRGPFWYRGYHNDEEGRYLQATSDDIDMILDFYGATAIVVGHSGVDQVEALYGGRVFGIDVPVPELESLQGLLWKDGVFYRVTGVGALEPIR